MVSLSDIRSIVWRKLNLVAIVQKFHKSLLLMCKKNQMEEKPEFRLVEIFFLSESRLDSVRVSTILELLLQKALNLEKRANAILRDLIILMWYSRGSGRAKCAPST